MRIVLFILKSFYQSMRQLIDLFWRWLEASFHLSPGLLTKKGQILLRIDERAEDDFVKLPINREYAFSITISAGLLDDRSPWGQAAFKVANLEAILPIMEAVARQELPHGVILLFWPSLVPCAFEIEMPLSLGDREERRDLLFKQLLYGIKRLMLMHDLDVIFVDNREMLGYKNSALLERLFLQSKTGLSR